MISPGRGNRNAAIKSPVMESIRMSKQMHSKALNHLQKQRKHSHQRNDSDDESSKSSEKMDIRQSFISQRRNNPKNMSMSRGTFFIHK